MTTPPAGAKRRTKSAETSEQPVDLGVLCQSIGYSLRRAQLAVFGDFVRSMEGFDVTPAQFSVLVVIERNPGLTQVRVANALGISRTNFVPLLNELERRGLARRAAAGDRRSHALVLTSEGAELVRCMRQAQGEHEERFAARLGEGGRAQLLALLGKLSEP